MLQQGSSNIGDNDRISTNTVGLHCKYHHAGSACAVTCNATSARAFATAPAVHHPSELALIPSSTAVAPCSDLQAKLLLRTGFIAKLQGFSYTLAGGRMVRIICNITLTASKLVA